MTMSTTPREKLAELRRLEALNATQAPAAPEPEPPAEPPAPVPVQEVMPPRQPPPLEQALLDRRGMPPRQPPPRQPPPEQGPLEVDPWVIDVSDLAGGTFAWRTETVNLSGPTVRATSAMHAQAIREHLAKLRGDLGLTPSGGTLRRMPTPGGTR